MKVSELIYILNCIDPDDEIEVGHSWYSGSEDEYSVAEPLVYYTENDTVILVADGSNYHDHIDFESRKFGWAFRIGEE